MATEHAPFRPEKDAAFYGERGPTVITVVSLFIGLTTVAVLLRFASRFSRRVRFGADDWFSVAALIIDIGFSATVILSVRRGMGIHDWAVDDSTSWRIVKMEYISSLINPIACVLVKVTLILFYRRVFTMNYKWFKYAWYSLFCSIIAHATAAFIGSVFQCIPPSYSWERVRLNHSAQGFCGVNNDALAMASNIMVIVIEVGLFILPITMLSRLQLKCSQKIGLMLIFGTGVLAIAAECVQLRYQILGSQSGVDGNWIIADIYLWAVIENSIGLICACLPIIGPLIVTIKDAILLYTTGSSPLGNAESSLGVSPGQSNSRCYSAIAGATDREAFEASMQMMSLEQALSQSQQGILRTEYNLGTCPRTGEISLQNHHDPKKPAGYVSIV
ncbi:uncharacterized protein GGS22DRAFT_163511 [Annulohypoxylon maeteangense]|uniref:uncharacterized protein n=1 Tax=Annulohypoxylon maeteangense TaxID=1927788 RepID=UPI0020075802|nr:uncharacterized protein GGS22DRAFT_163511 [Annulohypoxylon maeteangense]KAI0885362.1 hypothetical protein GGS22DRAFT_163511 [Annulohypoxylon maeteangense]